jgi:hypothetical protein
MHIFHHRPVHKEGVQPSPPQLSSEPLMSSPKEIPPNPRSATSERNRNSPQVPATQNHPCLDSS